VTFLFTDVENSTALWEAHPESMGRALARHDHLLRTAIGSHGGVVFATGGDGLAAAFGRAGDAVEAALEAQSSLAAASWPPPVDLRVRMGLHTGEAEERDGDYFGPAVNLAARLMAAAHGGQVVVSSTTKEIVEGALVDDVALVDLGEHRLRGVASPHRLFGVRAPGLASQFARLQTQNGPPGSLPIPLNRLIGREGEVRRLEQLLGESRVVTLTGPGGVGKSRLALAAAVAVQDTFPEGVWWVELAPVERPADVPAVVAASLGVRTGPGALGDALVAALEGRRLLVVLDNCEHVLHAADALVRDLVRGAATVKVLATSRERLGVEGERVLVVHPLAADSLDAPAVELLVERIDDQDVTADPAEQAALLEICQRLEGLPLGIELAAARCRALLPSEVVARLADRFRLLGDRRRGERHRTLRAIVEWSYQLLSESEQTLFARLSVFAGGLTLEAAEAVCAGGDLDRYDVGELLATLVEKSLVEHATRRYRLLETTRQFATELLQRGEGGERVRDSHLAFFTDFAGRARFGLRGPDEATWSARLAADMDNLRAAFQWACEQANVTAAISVSGRLAVEGFFRQPEVLLWIEEAYRRFGDLEHPDRRELVAAAAWAAWGLGDGPTCLRRAQLCAEVGNGAETAPDYLPEWALWASTLASRDTSRGVEICLTTAERARAAGDRWHEAWWLADAGVCLIFAGRIEDAIEPARQALAAARAADNPSAIAWAMFCEGSGFARNDAAYALDLVEQAHDIAASVGNRYVRNEALRMRGTLSARLVEPEGALGTLLEAAQDFRRAGQLFHMWMTLAEVPSVLVRLGRYEDAAAVAAAARLAPPAANAVFEKDLTRAESAIIDRIGRQRQAELAEHGRQLTTHTMIELLRADHSHGAAL
jgi:predicted ATPase/class 3 adenylate cyclase